MPVGHDKNDAAMNVAIKDPEHLIRFLRESKREFFVMKSDDLIRSLPLFKEGVEIVMQLVSCYREHRRGIPTGLVEDAVVKDPAYEGRERTRTLKIMKDETLETDELDALIAWAQDRKTELAARRAKLTNVREG